jgi:hypothetical protein
MGWVRQERPVPLKGKGRPIGEALESSEGPVRPESWGRAFHCPDRCSWPANFRQLSATTVLTGRLNDGIWQRRHALRLCRSPVPFPRRPWSCSSPSATHGREPPSFELLRTICRPPRSRKTMSRRSTMNWATRLGKRPQQVEGPGSPPGPWCFRVKQRRLLDHSRPARTFPSPPAENLR